MPILARFEKQPADEQDFDISFVDWLADMADTAPGPATATPGPNFLTIVAETGITIVATSLTDGVVKVWTSGGTDSTTYKITATVSTVGGRTKEAEIKIKVKEV